MHAAEDSDPCSSLGNDAYSKTISQHHPWLIRKTVCMCVCQRVSKRDAHFHVDTELADARSQVGIALSTLPRRKDMLAKMAAPGEPDLDLLR